MRKAILPVLFIAGMLICAGCKKEGTAEKAGKKLDEAGKALQDSAKKARDSIEKANK